MQVHAPDPYRPRVRVLFAKDGTRLDLPYDRNLWEAGPHRRRAATCDRRARVDPADYGIDPLELDLRRPADQRDADRCNVRDPTDPGYTPARD